MGAAKRAARVNERISGQGFPTKTQRPGNVYIVIPRSPLAPAPIPGRGGAVRSPFSRVVGEGAGGWGLPGDLLHTTALQRILPLCNTYALRWVRSRAIPTIRANPNASAVERLLNGTNGAR